MSKFAEVIKIATKINILNYIKSMNRTLDKLVVQVNGWEMEFNVNKYGVMHIRKRNLVSVPDE